MKVGHRPVLAEEVLTLLAPASGSLQIDATLGGGGHTERILEATDPDGRLLGLDADGAAIARVRARLAARFGDRLVLRQANFRELGEVAPAAGFDGRRRPPVRSRPVELPAGRRRAWLRDPDRRAARHALRPSVGVPASELLATLDARELAALFRRYGEEPQAGRIARAIVEARRTAPVSTAEELAALVERVAPGRPGQAPDPPRDPRLPGAPDRRQRGARCTRDGPRRGGRPAPARRPARRPQLPLARGPDRQAVHGRRAEGLHLPAVGADLRLRPIAAPPPDHEVPDRRSGRARRQPARSERPSPRRRTDRRVAADEPTGRTGARTQDPTTAPRGGRRTR